MVYVSTVFLFSVWGMTGSHVDRRWGRDEGSTSVRGSAVHRCEISVEIQHKQKMQAICIGSKWLCLNAEKCFAHFLIFLFYHFNRMMHIVMSVKFMLFYMAGEWGREQQQLSRLPQPDLNHCRQSSGRRRQSLDVADVRHVSLHCKNWGTNLI